MTDAASRSRILTLVFTDLADSTALKTRSVVAVPLRKNSSSP